MKQQFKDYLKNIGMTDALIVRVDEIFNFYEKVCLEEILDIFVSDFIKEDGSREYESLWFFSKNFAMEAKNFIVQEELDMAILHQNVIRWSVEKQEYDFQKAIEKSRLRVHVELPNMLVCDLKASKENCDYLRGILLNFFVSNFPK